MMEFHKFGLAANTVQHPGGRRNLSKSAIRALDILEHFALVGRPLRSGEVAQALDLQTSSADQLLKTLVDSAYLMFDPSNKHYYPSPRLANFGSWLSSNYFGGNRLYRLLQAVHHDTGDIVALAIRHSGSMQIVDFIEPVNCTDAIVKGSRVPVTESVIGTAFLALHSDKEVIRIVHQVNAVTGERLSTSELRQLLARVKKAKACGYALAASSSSTSPWALAVALPQSTSGMKMVLGMGGLGQFTSRKEHTYINIIRNHIERWFGI